MRVSEALLVEGSSRFAILCYGVFPSKKLDSVFELLSSSEESKGSRVYRLMGEGWPNGLLLIEVLVACRYEIALTTLKTLNRMVDVPSCLVSACMYDGAFGVYDDILAPEVAFQTYAICFSKEEPLIILDASVLASREWALIVASARQRLGGASEQLGFCVNALADHSGSAAAADSGAPESGRSAGESEQRTEPRPPEPGHSVRRDKPARPARDWR